MFFLSQASSMETIVCTSPQTLQQFLILCENLGLIGYGRKKLMIMNHVILKVSIMEGDKPNIPVFADIPIEAVT